MKNEIERRVDDVKSRRESFRDSFHTLPLIPSSARLSSRRSTNASSASSPEQSVATQSPKTDILVKIMCKYRVEFVFKVTRKTKLSRLFNAWTERMSGDVVDENTDADGSKSSKKSSKTTPSFIFTHYGRSLSEDETAEEAGIEDNDVIAAVEMMDLTEDVVRDMLICYVALCHLSFMCF